MSATLVPASQVRLPETYRSLMTVQDKLVVAQRAAAHVRDMGLTPVAASVIGSRLRGVDGPHSDTDTLVLVSERLPRAKSVTMTHLGDVEGQVQSVATFAELLSRSVPYAEFLRSPFRVTAPAYAPYLAALRPDERVLRRHAERIAARTLSRSGVPMGKRARTAACVHHLLETGSPLCPRTFASARTLPAETKAWLVSVAEEHEVDSETIADLHAALAR